MHIDWRILALQAINVLILVWLLSRFLYRPVLAIIAARQQAARTLLSDAQVAKDAALAETAALKARSSAFDAEAAGRRAEMEAQIADQRVRLLAQAHADAQAIATQVANKAEAERARLAGAWRGEAAALAGRMAETLLSRLPASLTTQAMFDALLAQLNHLTETERCKIAQDSPLMLLTPSPVAAQEQQSYRAALDVLFATTLAVDFAVDRALIAGFELHGTHTRLRNSWRADLDDMLSALKEDGHARIA